MGYKVLLAEATTGIVLNKDGRSRHINGGELPYIRFDSLAQALAFATSLVDSILMIEAGIWDEAGNYERTITKKTS